MDAIYQGCVLNTTTTKISRFEFNTDNIRPALYLTDELNLNLPTLGLLTLLTLVESRVKHKAFFLVKLYPLIAHLGSKIPHLCEAGRAPHSPVSLYLVIMYSMNSSRNDLMSKAGRAAAYEYLS